jgi:SOS-response transcriptional repressor LexA
MTDMRAAPASGLTRRQLACLDFIRACHLAHGVAPSLAEICAHLGLRSKSAAHRLVIALEARGAVTRLPGRNRSLMPVARNAITVDLPRELDAAVRALAVQAGVTPAAVLIEAARDGLSAFRSRSASRETSAGKAA